ncbi:MAG: PAS domain S-box protein [Syntrophotaleaceae bacterium]
MFLGGGPYKKTMHLLPRGIRGRLYLLIALVLVPMLLLLVLMYVGTYQNRRAAAIQTELEVAQGIATTFAAKVEDIHRQSLAVGDAILTLSPYTESKARRILAFNANQYRVMRNLCWVSPAGKVMVSSDPALVGRDLTGKSYFQKIRAGNSWAVGDLERLEQEKSDWGFAIASAVRTALGLRWVVVAVIDPTFLDEAVFQQRLAGGAYTLFDNQGVLVFRSGTNGTQANGFTWGERLRWRETDALLIRALRGDQSQAGEVGLEVPGGNWLAARVPVRGIGWIAGSARPSEMVIAPLRQRLVRDAGLALLITSGAILLAWHLSRTISGPILRLERDARAMGAGKIPRQDDFEASTEVRQLRQTVAGMAGELLGRAAALRASEEKFRAIFEQAGVGIGRVNFDDARWIDVNDAFCAMLGYSAEEMRLTPWPQITHPDDVDLDLIPFKRMAAGELDNYTVEKRFLHKKGHFVWARLTLSLVWDAEGRPDYEIAVIEDISERKQAEEELHRLNLELEQRVQERTAALMAVNQELEAFTYTVSHDLRAPLRHITSFVDLMMNRYGKSLDETGNRYIRIIGDAGRRMSSLIDDLLTFSRIGRASLDKRKISLKTLVREVCKELTYEVEGRKIEWRIEELPQVEADPVLLRNVITNLVANALKYTRHRNPARIEIGCSESTDEIVCFVKDNGAGFDMRFADKLFGVFQRLHPQEEFEGTGIGLASVRRIIQRHGGRAWAEGEVDKGATFYFTLPREGRGT